MIEASGVPYTVLRATQFFEFLKSIADGGTEGKTIHMSPSKFQPVAADDVAATLAKIATAQPKNSVVELAGPEASSMAEFIQSFLSSVGDERKIIADPNSKYFGAILDQDGLAPSGEFIAGPTRLADWIRAMLSSSRKGVSTVKKVALLLLAVASLLSTDVAAEETNAPASKVTKIFDRELPNVPGKSMRAVLVEYGPGAASPSHRHPSSAFIYATVFEGEIRSQVNDQPAHVYKAGESWTEVPGDHHKVSANASSTKPARLLAIFVVDTTEKEIVIPDK
jgi:quercetin dioxygenase-like cupin family protein